VLKNEGVMREMDTEQIMKDLQRISEIQATDPSAYKWAIELMKYSLQDYKNFQDAYVESD